MVADPWIVKMGNQVSSNLKQAILETSKKKKYHRRPENSQVIGILSFEVANVMAKIVHLHKSLTESEISALKTEIFSSEVVRELISSNDSYLLELIVAEKLDELNRVASVVSRLGKKCSEPALQGFEHVYRDIVRGVIHVKELGFLVKDMEGMVKKMDRYVHATRNLYRDMEVLKELDLAVKKFQNNQHEESRRAFEQKLTWQKQDVQHLKEISIWNQSYDKVVDLLARTVCTIYARLSVIFEDSTLRRADLRQSGDPSLTMADEFHSVSSEATHQQARISSERWRGDFSQRNGCSRLIERTKREKKEADRKSQMEIRRGEIASFRPQDFAFPCGTSPGRLFMECISLSSSVSTFDDNDGIENLGESRQISVCSSVEKGGRKWDHPFHSGLLNSEKPGISSNGDYIKSKYGTIKNSTCDPKSKVAVYALPCTIGGSALALHYANVIIFIEKLLRCLHLVGEEARGDLYNMLPASLRKSLRAKLKSYVNSLAICDAPLALAWKETLDGILAWLAPLAHNMIRWQSERNFEQHKIVARTNVLLLQTLFFADREKTEEAICDLLVGLNYICHYEQQQNARLESASSFDIEDCMEWESQSGASFLN